VAIVGVLKKVAVVGVRRRVAMVGVLKKVKILSVLRKLGIVRISSTEDDNNGRVSRQVGMLVTVRKVEMIWT